MALTKPVDSIKPSYLQKPKTKGGIAHELPSRHHTGCRYRADYGSGSQAIK